MKIAIITELSIPTSISLSDYISPDDPICKKTSHPHPWVTNLAQSLVKIKGNEIHIITILQDVNKDRTFVYDNVHYHLIKSNLNLHKSLSFVNSNKREIKKILNKDVYKKVQYYYIDSIINLLKTNTLFKSNKWKVHNLLKQIGPNVVHGQGKGREGYYAISSGFPCVITNHGNNDEFFNAMLNGKKNFNYYIAKYNENRVNRKMKYCINVSPNCVNKGNPQLINSNHDYLLDNPISPDFFKVRDISFNDSILYAGSIQNRKQILQLVKAVEEVEGAKLRIASLGDGSDYYEMVRNYIKINNLDQRVSFIGFKDQEGLAEEISKCLCVCLPSTYESFGMVLAEAMAVGKPVIASNLEGTRYVVNNNETGFLFEAGNIYMLSEKIRFLINNKDVAKRMGEAGRKEAFRRWHPDIIAVKTMEVYKDVIAEWS